MKIGTSYPFPEKAVVKFLKGLTDVLVLEELDPYLEEQIYRISGIYGLEVKVHGKYSKEVFSAGENTMGNCPFYFVAVILEIITPMYAGCTVHFLPEQQRRDNQFIEEYAAGESITVMHLTVQPLRYFKKPGKSLRLVLTGSERLMNAKGEGYTLLNLYGSSETGGPAFAFQTDRCYENTPIGQPAAGMNAVAVSVFGFHFFHYPYRV